MEVRLSAARSACVRLTLTHTAHLSEHWGEYGPGAVGVGWELGLLGLAMYLTHTRPCRSPTKPPLQLHGAARRSSQVAASGGGQAAVAAGVDPDATRAALRRTTAFYTGESAGPA